MIINLRKAFLGASLFMVFDSSAQIANHVVISELYGGGGNAGSTYKNDFIELYNPTSSAVSLAGWSVQYASSGGAFTQVTTLSGTIPAKGFYLIQEAAGSGGTVNLPTPDTTGNIAMSGTAGKVALVNTSTALGTNCTGSQIIDLVGYGSGTSCSEGSSPTGTINNSTSAERKASSTSTALSLAPGGAEVAAGNGYDAGVNNTDFVVQSAVNPQNSSMTEGVVGNTVSASAGIAAAEPATDGTFTITLSTAAPAGGVVITYSLAGTATAGGTDYTDLQSGTLTIPMGAITGTLTIDVVDDLLPESNETIFLTLLTASAGYTLAGTTATITITDNDAPATQLSTIQGNGATATSGTFTAEAIVTGVYPSLSPAGFYMQEETADADTSTATSEAIFVVTATAVAVGDKVRVTGTVQESAATPSFGQAVFTAGSSVTILGNNNPLPAITDIVLPMAAISDFEKYEGMLVRFPDTLTVTNNFTLGRFGEVGLSAGGAVYQPTQVIDLNDAVPAGTTSSGTSNIAAINALAASNALRTILLDDGTNTTVTLPCADPADSTLRLGSFIDSLTGIMGYAFNVYRIQPVPSAPPSFVYTARPVVVPSVGGANLKIASFNVLNYFNGNGTGGGFPTSRGAHSAAEFSRQRAKIISAIAQINADVVGLIEVENDGVGANSAIQDLVNGLNGVLGAGTYSIINDGAFVQTYGTDEIRCGIIYKSTAVTPFGTAMLSPSTTFNRPPLAQTFTANAFSTKFNFIINHFKSKGCTGSTGADLDQADGQSCFNSRRKLQSAELLNFIDTAVIPNSGTSLIISMGDYNAYYEEDPLDVLRAANYTVLSSSATYSYQFDGQIGSLDHAVVSPSISPYVTGIAKWNINAAEPVYLDYNDAINDGGGDFINQFAGTYTPTPFRSSDHDPVLVGLNFTTPLPLSLTSFDAVKNGNTVKLQWTTTDEKDIRNFLVERSVDGAQWHAIADVAVTAAHNGAANYTATDMAPEKGTNLYRIKTVETSGGFIYSRTRNVEFGTVFNYTIYPNPAADVLLIEMSSEMMPGTKVEITNTMGQVLISYRINSAEERIWLDVSSLVEGVYCLQIVSPQGETMASRFMKK